MTNRRFFRILLPAITFLGGVFIQLLIEKWVSIGFVTSLSLILVLLSLAVLFTASLHILESIESKFSEVDKNLGNKFEHVSQKLDEIFGHLGLFVECIEDGSEGKSYLRASELINKAEHSLTIVSPWDSFLEQRRDTTTEVRANYYKAMERKITEHQHDKQIFHRRIVQVPKKYEDEKATLEFAKETPFLDYLKHCAVTQLNFPLSCSIRKSSTIIDIHFTIIDQRYIIMPIFTTNEEHNLIRYGALFYDDLQKHFVNYLESIYKILESLSKPIYLDSFILTSEEDYNASHSA